MSLQYWLTGYVTHKLSSTIILIVTVLIIRKYVVHWVKSKETFLPKLKRQWIVHIRNITIFLILGILVVVWLEQLRTIAASIVVIAAAIVIATKEFLLNVVGFFYRTTAKFVSVGDRIEVDGIRRNVIDQSLMGNTLLEVGPGDRTHQYTGRHGIGLHTGNVAANISSTQRLSYALVGETVNIASRIQDLNKNFDTDILISDAVKQGLDRCVDLTPIPPVPVKGIREPLNLLSIEKRPFIYLDSI